MVPLFLILVFSLLCFVSYNLSELLKIKGISLLLSQKVPTRCHTGTSEKGTSAIA